jgi:hypothetical protein
VGLRVPRPNHVGRIRPAPFDAINSCVGLRVPRPVMGPISTCGEPVPSTAAWSFEYHDRERSRRGGCATADHQQLRGASSATTDASEDFLLLLVPRLEAAVARVVRGPSHQQPRGAANATTIHWNAGGTLTSNSRAGLRVLRHRAVGNVSVVLT